MAVKVKKNDEVNQEVDWTVRWWIYISEVTTEEEQAQRLRGG